VAPFVTCVAPAQWRATSRPAQPPVAPPAPRRRHSATGTAPPAQRHRHRATGTAPLAPRHRHRPTGTAPPAPPHRHRAASARVAAHAPTRPPARHATIPAAWTPRRCSPAPRTTGTALSAPASLLARPSSAPRASHHRRPCRSPPALPLRPARRAPRHRRRVAARPPPLQQARPHPRPRLCPPTDPPHEEHPTTGARVAPARPPPAPCMTGTVLPACTSLPSPPFCMGTVPLVPACLPTRLPPTRRAPCHRRLRRCRPAPPVFTGTVPPASASLPACPIYYGHGVCLAGVRARAPNPHTTGTVPPAPTLLPAHPPLPQAPYLGRPHACLPTHPPHDRHCATGARVAARPHAELYGHGVIHSSVAGRSSSPRATGQHHCRWRCCPPATPSPPVPQAQRHRRARRCPSARPPPPAPRVPRHRRPCRGLPAPCTTGTLSPAPAWRSACQTSV